MDTLRFNDWLKVEKVKGAWFVEIRSLNKGVVVVETIEVHVDKKGKAYDTFYTCAEIGE